MPRESREVWKKRIERWADSGLTAQEFADEIGVNVHTLSGWKWRLSTEAARAALDSGHTGAGFVEVVAPLMASESPASRTTAADPLELVLPGGLVLRVPAHFDAPALRRVVDILGGR
jgi:hypothetical protein